MGFEFHLLVVFLALLIEKLEFCAVGNNGVVVVAPVVVAEGRFVLKCAQY